VHPGLLEEPASRHAKPVAEVPGQEVVTITFAGLIPLDTIDLVNAVTFALVAEQLELRVVVQEMPFHDEPRTTA
jgi:hypothetical protein